MAGIRYLTYDGFSVCLTHSLQSLRKDRLQRRTCSKSISAEKAGWSVTSLYVPFGMCRLSQPLGSRGVSGSGMTCPFSTNPRLPSRESALARNQASYSRFGSTTAIRQCGLMPRARSTMVGPSSAGQSSSASSRMSIQPLFLALVEASSRYFRNSLSLFKSGHGVPGWVFAPRYNSLGSTNIKIGS